MPGDYSEAFIEPRAKARGNSIITYWNSYCYHLNL